MNDLFALMCFAGLIFFALLAFATMMGLGNLRRSTFPYSTRGNEIPRFDDPNVSSGGSFGPSPMSSGGINLGGEARRHDDPNIRSGGSFGG